MPRSHDKAGSISARRTHDEPGFMSWLSHRSTGVNKDLIFQAFTKLAWLVVRSSNAHDLARRARRGNSLCQLCRVNGILHVYVIKSQATFY